MITLGLKLTECTDSMTSPDDQPDTWWLGITVIVYI